MGNPCSKGKPAVRMHELKFMSSCTEGCYGKPSLLDAIFDEAAGEGLQDQIFNAKDEDDNLPIHKACMHGNPTVLQWIINKWAEVGRTLDIDTPDHAGYSPLYLVCYKGYLGAEAVMGNSPEVKKKRIECAKILLKAGA